MKVDGLDHLVLTVKDINEACAFYSRVLGMEVAHFGNGRVALAFGLQKINLHEYPSAVKLKAQNPRPGSADLCFVTSIPLPDVMDHLNSCGIKLVEGPVQRVGARGPILSIYFRDSDMNLIEVCNYV